MEKVNIYNRNRELTDIIKERNKLEKGEYRISAHIWIINKENEMLIQQRVAKQKNSPICGLKLEEGFWQMKIVKKL